VGYVGRLAAEKELELLTSLAGDRRFRLVLVGSGPDELRLRSLLPDAFFTGTLHGPELGAAYASLDVFVHTGRHETYCQSAQEALASGVPVVAPRAGGPVDVVDDGVAGHLYRPGDRDDLRSHVDQLVGDDLGRRRMGMAARRSVRGRSWRTVNDALVEHYREVVEERTGVSAPVAGAPRATRRVSRAG
jgi:phosphatidylinositol alpha 1,6-mannosyltransferase